MAKGGPLSPPSPKGLLLDQGGPLLLLGKAKGAPCQATRAPCRAKWPPARLRGPLSRPKSLWLGQRGPS